MIFVDGFPTIFTIYDRPRDVPNKIVLRAWHGENPGPAIAVDTIEEARNIARLFGACVNLGRMPDDEPQIVESWI